MEKDFFRNSITFGAIFLFICLISVVAFAGCGEKTYTVKFASNNTDYGSVSELSVKNVAADTVIVINGNTITLGSKTITATPASATSLYTFAFSGWSGVENGDKITEDITITATFTRSTIGGGDPSEETDSPYTVAEVKSALAALGTSAEEYSAIAGMSLAYSELLTNYAENTPFVATWSNGQNTVNYNTIIKTNTQNKTIEIFINTDDIETLSYTLYDIAQYMKLSVTLNNTNAPVSAKFYAFGKALENNMSYGILETAEEYSALTNQTTNSSTARYTQNYVAAHPSATAMTTPEETIFNNIANAFATNTFSTTEVKTVLNILAEHSDQGNLSGYANMLKDITSYSQNIPFIKTDTTSAETPIQYNTIISTNKAAREISIYITATNLTNTYTGMYIQIKISLNTNGSIANATLNVFASGHDNTGDYDYGVCLLSEYYDGTSDTTTNDAINSYTKTYTENHPEATEMTKADYELYEILENISMYAQA